MADQLCLNCQLTLAAHPTPVCDVFTMKAPVLTGNKAETNLPHDWQAKPGMITSETPKDMVNHPPHYSGHPSGIECFKVAKHLSMPIGTAFKYVYRFEDKWDPAEDLDKAKWYVENCPAEELTTGISNRKLIIDVHSMVAADYATGRPACAERARFMLALLEGERLKMLSAIRALIALQNPVEARDIPMGARASDPKIEAAKRFAESMRDSEYRMGGFSHRTNNAEVANLLAHHNNLMDKYGSTFSRNSKSKTYRDIMATRARLRELGVPDDQY